jgi:hypothetical protein
MVGNSEQVTSGIIGWGAKAQSMLGIPDEERLFEMDTHRSVNGGIMHPSLVRALSI